MLSIEYLAGLFDGEGCISLAQGGAVKNGYVSFGLRMAICMCYKPIIEQIHNDYGGNKIARRRTDGNRRDQWTWHITGKAAEELLNLLIPHLIVKKEEALVCKEALNYRRSLPKGVGGRRGGTPRTTEQKEKLQEYVDKVKALKKIEYKIEGGRR